MFLGSPISISGVPAATTCSLSTRSLRTTPLIGDITGTQQSALPLPVPDALGWIRCASALASSLWRSARLALACSTAACAVSRSVTAFSSARDEIAPFSASCLARSRSETRQPFAGLGAGHLRLRQPDRRPRRTRRRLQLVLGAHVEQRRLGRLDGGDRRPLRAHHVADMHGDAVELAGNRRRDAEHVADLGHALLVHGHFEGAAADDCDVDADRRGQERVDDDPRPPRRWRRSPGCA